MMNIKKHILSLLLLSACGSVWAEGNNDSVISGDVAGERGKKSAYEMIDKPFMMILSVGPNFNTGGHHNSQWFGLRQDVATQTDIRLNFGFHRHWSVYADLGITWYRWKSDDLVENIGDALISILVPGFNRLHPSFSVGATYLTQVGPWQFMPHFGVGCLNVKNNHKTSEHKGVKTEIKREISPYYIESGFGVGFRTSRLCSLILDVNYRYPLESATLKLKRTEDGHTSVSKYKSDSWANDLTVSLGIQFQTGLGRRKK